MSRESERVYCAGPLFNVKEREEMAELAAALEGAGYETFLPQRDGLELTKVVDALTKRGVEPVVASDVCAKAIFALDVYQVIVECGAIVVNLNGRVPDEGAVSEAAIAWCSGKAVVGFKADSRSVFIGQDNPLVTGLFNFEVCRSFGEVLGALERELERHQGDHAAEAPRIGEIAEYLTLGSRIWQAAHSGSGFDQVTEVLLAETRAGASCGGQEAESRAG